jgi:P27 family predicted phage terminase small subunit
LDEQEPFACRTGAIPLLFRTPPRFKFLEDQTMADLPTPPEHLSQSSREWWASVLRDYALEPHHLRLLQAAAESWDRFQQARETIARDGLTVPTADGGLKAHPCVAIERDSRLAFARLLRELDLDCGSPTDTTRPPALASNRRI